VAVPAFALNTGPPDVSALPSGAKARIAFEEVSRVMGPGFATPYNIIVVARNRPITDPATLTSINRFQHTIAASNTVYSVSGPAAIYSTSEQLKKFGPGLVNSAKVSKKSKKDLVTLINGLGQAGSGSAQLQSGLQQAVSGANQLHGGSGQAQSGSAQLHAGLAQARSGSTQLSGGLDQALSGAVALKNGAGQALAGSGQLAGGLAQGVTDINNSVVALQGMATLAANSNAAVGRAKSSSEGSVSGVASAQSALAGMKVGKTDPNYGAVASALASASSAANATSGELSTAAGLSGQTSSLAGAIGTAAPAQAAKIKAAAAGAAQLESGIQQLRNGNAQLATGMSQLAGGGSQLKNGLGQLTNGAGQLEAGLTLLNSGTGQLASGLAPAPAGAGQLVNGLGLMQAGVIKSRGQIPSTKDLETLMKQSPGMFSSGYFVLSAVEGALPSDRNAATFTINLLNGGNAGQILVVSKYKDSDPRTVALGNHLVSLSQSYAKRNNAQVAVGGPAGNRGDMTTLTKDRIPLVIVGIALSLMLILALALRAVVLPVVTTAFSLLVTASTFGVLQLLYGGSNPPLGGPGWLDPMTILGIFTVVFSVSVVFSTWLLMRAREAYVGGEGTKGSVAIGLRATAAAATGAGLAMLAAIIPFALTDFLNVQQFGIGVAVAILLEVVLVRPVLVPAGAVVLGRFGWWPTHGPQDDTTQVGEEPRARRRQHLPHRRPHPAA
jgi:RND superfamily putative drug exporter